MLRHDVLRFPTFLRRGAPAGVVFGCALAIALVPQAGAANDPTPGPAPILSTPSYSFPPGPLTAVTTRPTIVVTPLQIPKLPARPPGLSEKSSVRLNAVRVASSEVDQTGNCSAPLISKPNPKPPARLTALTVGWATTTLPCSGTLGTAGRYVDSESYRGAVYFNTSNIDWARVTHALLVLTASGPSTSGPSCAVTVSNAVSPWWTESGQIAIGSFSLPVEAHNLYEAPGEAIFDVDWFGVVWTEGVANFGLVLRGAHEDMAPGSCLTTYNSPTLAVEYR
jgi:hypothetical protein